MKKPKLLWEYIGEELAIFWISPYSGKKEKVATFWWPAHPIEATKQVEEIFERIATMAVGEFDAPVSRECEECTATYNPDRWDCKECIRNPRFRDFWKPRPSGEAK